MRRAFLCGEGLEHRKRWIEDRIELSAANFVVSVCGFSVMDNHLHVLVRLDPGLADGWSDEEVVRICAYCVLPNHWHFVMWPEHDGDLGAFMQRLTVTHSARWKQHKKQVGFGHLYQGRYKSFPIEADDHFLKVVRYVERNALRANLVRKAENWKWSSLWIRKFGSAEHRRLLCPWPVPGPRNWVEHVNRPETEAEPKALRRSVNRGTPFGSPAWIHKTAKRLGLEFTTRPRGRPKKR